MRYLFLSGLAIFLIFPILKAQDEIPPPVVDNVLAKVIDEEGREVEIFYTLEDEAPEAEYYRVSVFGLFDGRRYNLTRLQGDVGDSVRVGNNKIVWNAFDEFPRFRGDIEFEVQVLRTFQILHPVPGTVMKRGNVFTFDWFGGESQSDILTLELFQNKILIDTLGVSNKSLAYDWKVPKRNLVGEGFQLKITGTDRTGIEAFSPEFAIKRKIPLAVQIGVPVAAAITAAILSLLSAPGEEGPLPPPLLPDEQ